jgi:hypothetical protein
MQVSKKPLKVLDSLRVGPCFADRPLEITRDSQLSPPGRPAAVRPKFRQGLAGVRLGKSWGGARVR